MVSFNKVTRVIAGIAATALLIPMAACGGGSSSGGSAAPADIPAAGTDDGTEITLWTRSPLERQAKNAVKAYNASHKNQVKLEIIPNDDMEGKVGGASQTDSLPDILAGDVVRIPYWASEGIFTDITKQIDGLDNKSDLQQGHIEAGTVDGKEYTLPFITDVSVMVWNKNLYKEAGLDPEKGPSSIDEFVEQAKAVAALNKDGVAGSYLAGQSGGALVFDLFPSVWADGESVMNADGTEATLDNDSMKAVLDAYKELANTTNGLGAGSKEETGAELDHAVGGSDCGAVSSADADRDFFDVLVGGLRLFCIHDVDVVVFLDLLHTAGDLVGIEDDDDTYFPESLVVA